MGLRGKAGRPGPERRAGLRPPGPHSRRASRRPTKEHLRPTAPTRLEERMNEVSNRIVQKLWSYCNVLRDDGLSYQDYLEQLTTLLCLKMAEEREEMTGREQPI